MNKNMLMTSVKVLPKLSLMSPRTSQHSNRKSVKFTSSRNINMKTRDDIKSHFDALEAEIDSLPIDYLQSKVWSPQTKHSKTK
jgi:hypothetical protein